MQQFQDDIMKNRLLIEKINKALLEKIASLEKRLDILESGLHETNINP